MANFTEIEMGMESFIKENLYPKEKERNEVSKRYEELGNILPGFHLFQSGSYARRTATTPMNDLDVICESEDPEKSVREIFERLKQVYGKDSVRFQTHSIGVTFASDESILSIDVVPAKKSELRNRDYGDSLYILPELLRHSRRNRKMFYDSDSAILSDPKGYINQAMEVDNNSNKKFKRAVKFLKRWNYAVKEIESETFKGFKSFHIEEILKRYFLENPSLSIYESVHKFLNDAGSFLERPQFPDRADASIHVDSYVQDIGPEGKRQIIHYVENAKNLLSLLSIKETSEISGILKLILSPNSMPEKPKQTYVKPSYSPHYRNEGSY